MLQIPQYKPDTTRSEAIVDRALAIGQIPREQIEVMRPAAAPQELFPSKAGKAFQWTIDGVLNINRTTPLYRSWTSGMPQQWTTLTDDGYSGSTRNSLEVM